MRCAHRPACRGQRFALPTAPAFDHKLHSLPPRKVKLLRLSSQSKRSAPKDHLIATGPDRTSARWLRQGYVRRVKPTRLQLVFADRSQSATVDRGTESMLAMVREE